ncbi:P-loop NTPase fold protein [uncultured Pantoea sp.]|uniref:KAP family P-loop NTPase fold protein n=1 Tax=uncultured Pantoea sp. TaxID=218084 RepID=UPI00258741B2|nr:P-loop NTPase fold protein [uncultured Pantoea sp.]
MTNSSMPSVLDKHISSVNEDSFGHRHFAQALQGLIESESNSAPYSIGLLGDWGTGKSSIKELYLNELENDLNKDSDGFKRADKIHTITYNAWRYGGKDQDVKRTLLRHVFLELGGDEEQLKDKLYNQINVTQSRKKSFFEITKEYLRSWLAPFPAFTVIIISLLIVLGISSSLFPESDNGYAKGIFLSCLTFVFGFILKQFKSPPVNLTSPVNKIILPSVSSEQYEEMLLTQVKSFVSGKVENLKKAGKNCKRIVVFIDDLDRLSSEEMVTGLDAIRTFMEMPTSAVGSRNVGMIFVISCDERRVADALSRGRKNGDMPGTVFSSHDARRYLDRIFQFRLEIPPFPRQDMRGYALSLFKTQPKIISEIESSGNKVDSVVDRMIYPGVGTPRNALQIVNAFFHSWWIAKRRELEHNENRPGGLHDKAVTAHPISLGAICTLKVNFPEFYDQLLSDPTLIERFTDVLVRKKDIQEQPLTVKILLTEKYIVVSEQQEYEVHSHHRELRTFLASLVGTRWPESLQSLLYLTEDPITRKFGSAVSKIYDYLVSGDSSSVLEQLGKNSGNSVLSSNEATLIYQMTEDLNRESETRRDNAFRVIAEIINRVPSELTSKLSGQLCIALSDSINLRSMVGIKSITDVVRFSTQSNKVSIATRVIEDSFTDKGILSSLENLGTPTLDDAEKIAISSANLVLEVLNETPIGERPTNLFMNWVVNRTVKLSEKSTQISFSVFEEWVNKYQGLILNSIEANYIDILEEKINNSGEESFDIDTSLVNVLFVFNKMWSGGAIEQGKVLSLLSNSQRLTSPKYINTVWDYASSRKNSFSVDAANDFIGSISKNLEKMNVGNKENSFNLKGFSVLLDFITVSRENISTDAFEKINSVLINYSSDIDYTDMIISIMSQLEKDFDIENDPVITNWYNSDIEDIPSEYIKFATKRFSIISQEAKDVTTSFLTTVVSSNEPSKEQTEKYSEILKSVERNEEIHLSIISHIETAFSQVNSKYSNVKFCSSILPLLMPFIGKINNEKIKAFLADYINKSRNNVPAISVLMFSMNGNWTLLKSSIPDFNFDYFFDTTYNCLISNQTNTNHPISTLSGLKSFIDNEYVPYSYKEKLITLACQIWKTHPKQVISSLMDGFTGLTIEQFADLADDMNSKDEEFKKSLKEAWGYKEYSLTYHLESFEYLLNSTLIQLSRLDKFNVLLAWFDYCNLEMLGFYNAVLESSGVSNEDKALVFDVYHEMNLLNDLNLLNFTINKIVKSTNENSLSDKVLNSKDVISRHLNSNEARYAFVKAMLDEFKDIHYLTYRKKVALWGKELIGNDALNFIKADDIDSDDLEYLGEIYKSASRLKTLRRNVDSNQS